MTTATTTATTTASMPASIMNVNEQANIYIYISIYIVLCMYHQLRTLFLLVLPFDFLSVRHEILLYTFISTTLSIDVNRTYIFVKVCDSDGCCAHASTIYLFRESLLAVFFTVANFDWVTILANNVTIKLFSFPFRVKTPRLPLSSPCRHRSSLLSSISLTLFIDREAKQRRAHESSKLKYSTHRA